MEIWKDIKGYEGLYQVSNLGRVKSLGNSKSKKEKILKPFKRGRGYLTVKLFNNNKKKQIFIHRLVAETFIDNPDNLPQVNHKDENKQNNLLDNLEWCTNKDNARYSFSKEILATNINTKEKIIFTSIGEARKLGFNHVSDCCLNKRKQDKGYVFEYIKEGNNE
jgi:hypothetical protein